MAITAGSALNSVAASQKQTLATNYIDFNQDMGWAQQYLPELMEKEAEVFGPRTISGFLSKVGAEESMQSDQVFNNKFKGFEYNVGDKKYRFNVKNTEEVKNTQSDINNFVKKFLNENNTMEDAKGYHKSLYTAMNADAIANHFYEQGKADAIKDGVAKAKNINTMSRSSHNEPMDNCGYKVRVLGDNADSFKFKIKSKNKN